MNESPLLQCLAIIEQKLGWIDNSLWTHQDFELLSERIFSETKTKLSASTLKRLWGKVSHQGEPSISTLNALASFIGYSTWNEYKNSQSRLKPAPKEARPVLRYFIAALVITIVVTVIAYAIQKSTKPVFSESEKSKILFGSKFVSDGLPNTILFTYDLTTIKPKQVKIQQSWNQDLTFSVNPDLHEATAIYYYPGYFRAKLIGDDQILREHDVNITSDGWLATVDGSEIPLYFREEEIRGQGVLRLHSSSLDELQLQRGTEQISFHYFNDLDSANGANFTYEARFKNTSKNGCRNSSLLIHGTEAVFIASFSIPGCVSDLDLMVAGREVSGKSNDLSAFGLNSTEWQTFRLEVLNDDASYFLNDKLIRKEKVEKNIGNIMGFRFRFTGSGELDFVKLYSHTLLIFEDQF